MKRYLKRLTVFVLIISLAAMALALSGCGSGGSSGGGASGGSELDSVIKDASEFLVENVEVDSLDSMGGGWIPFALRMSGTDAADDEYYEAYYDSVRVAAKTNGGVLSEDRPTANERVSMNLRALGKDPTNVEGEDLMKVVDDYDLICRQGLNAEIYALISANYVGYTLEHEDDYLNDLIESQNPDGAFGMDSKHPDSDMTAMALQALSAYDSRIEGNKKSDPRAEKAIDKALEWLKEMQQDDGSFGNSESTAQVIIAMNCLRMDPEGEEFTKGENSLYDGLMAFHTDKGFSHEAGDEVDIMATEQSLMALDAIKMAKNGERIFG
ncbi:MAG: hypothetical protein IKF07_03750 [Eubacterium sp.]|nr:hypothetical protein [Eubacterium sp.]